jgi:hypothetical protein
MIAAASRIFFSITWNLFTNSPTLETEYTRSIEKNITGNAAAIANTEGIMIGSPAAIDIGMSIPKNRTALNGQNERAKIKPRPLLSLLHAQRTRLLKKLKELQ